MIKKFLATTALTLALTLGMASTGQAALAVAFPVYGSLISMLGFGGSIVGFNYGQTFYGKKEYSRSRAVFFGYGTMFLFMDAQTNSLQFKALDNDFASKLGVTEEEKNLFNDERERLNVLVQEASIKLMDFDGDANDFQNIYDDIADEVSKETMSTVVKIINASK